MTTPVPPPSLAERLLRAAVRDPDWREAIAGDLREEFSTVVARSGVSRARRWYWRAAVPLTMRFTVARLVPSAAPPRHRRVSIAQIESASLLGAGWSREFGHAWRAVTRRPAISAVIVGTIAVALAANTVIYTAADALYLRPFRFPAVDRLVAIASDSPIDSPFVDRESVAPADFRDWTTMLSSLERLTAIGWWDPNLSGVDVPEQIPGVKVTPGFFETLGVVPALGHWLRPEEAADGANRTVVLSHAFWQRQFAGDPGVIGRTIRLDGESYEVVGVAPPRFQVPFGANVWAPITSSDVDWAERRRGNLMVVGRLARGRTMADARHELEAVTARLAAAYPDTNRNRPVLVRTLARGLGDDGVGPFLLICQAAATLLLLVACANVANLLLARGTERQAEFAVRLALGAGRGRLIAQLLLEGICLATLAVGAGAVLAAKTVTATRAMLPASIIRFVPGYDFLTLDLSAFGATAALGAAATVLFALLPALQAVRSAMAHGAMGAQRTSSAPAGRQRMRAVLAGTQVALTLAVGVAAALLVDGVERTTGTSVGFDRRHLATAQLTLPERPYEDTERRRQFVMAVIERVAARPGVSGIAAVSALPFSGQTTSRPFLPEGVDIEERDARKVFFVRSTPGYFATMRIPVAEGRDLARTDGPDAPPVAVISRSLAARFFPDGRALGRRFRLGAGRPWLTVVGVVGDVVSEVFIGRWEPTVYVPFAQQPSLAASFVARTAGSADALEADLRRAVTAVDADQPVQQLVSMEALMKERMAGFDFFARALLAMSGLALLLSLTGMYSLMAYLAAQRTREIGVRVALGATRAQVTWLATSRALRITVAGVVLGAALSVGVSRAMQNALYGLVTPNVAMTTAAAALLAVAALAAGYLPARRAALQDPWQALRRE